MVTSVFAQLFKNIHLEITEDRFGGFGLRARLGRSQALLLARRALVRADFKFFGGPEGTSSVYLRASWPFLRSNLLL